MLQQTLHNTYVEESARWMGSCKHNYWHWLHCQLPQGRVRLTDLKLSHPEVIPNRDRMAAPMRLASWIRFETLMVGGSDRHAGLQPPPSDQELLRLRNGEKFQSRLLAPIPFREVFVILALFLPQLTFLEGTRAQRTCGLALL